MCLSTSLALRAPGRQWVVGRLSREAAGGVPPLPG